MCTYSRVTAQGRVTYHGNDDKEALTDAAVDIHDDPNVSKIVVKAK